MTGDEFLNLAIRLANSDVEADIRTSVSRSYYGAFHKGLEFLERCGIELPRSADAHEKQSPKRGGPKVAEERFISLSATSASKTH